MQKHANLLTIAILIAAIVIEFSPQIQRPFEGADDRREI